MCPSRYDFRLDVCGTNGTPAGLVGGLQACVLPDMISVLTCAVRRLASLVSFKACVLPDMISVLTCAVPAVRWLASLVGFKACVLPDQISILMCAVSQGSTLSLTKSQSPDTWTL